GLMQKEGLDGLYLNRIENVRYSTDARPVVSIWFQNSYSSIVTSRGDVVLLTVAGDYMHFKHYMTWMEDIRIVHGIGRADEVKKIFMDHGLKKIGYDSLSLEEYRALGSASPGLELVGIGARIAEERAVKFEEEIALMRQASKVTEASVRSALKSVKP